jgi:RNA polymerase sigma factor (sigma-70 family)
VSALAIADRNELVLAAVPFIATAVKKRVPISHCAEVRQLCLLQMLRVADRFNADRAALSTFAWTVARSTIERWRQAEHQAQLVELFSDLDLDPDSPKSPVEPPSREPDPAVWAERRDERRLVRRWIKTLPWHYRLILAERFGLLGRRARSQREIARKYGMTVQRVQQIEHTALARLKRIAPA